MHSDALTTMTSDVPLCYMQGAAVDHTAKGEFAPRIGDFAIISSSLVSPSLPLRFPFSNLNASCAGSPGDGKHPATHGLAVVLYDGERVSIG